MVRIFIIIFIVSHLLIPHPLLSQIYYNPPPVQQGFMMKLWMSPYGNLGWNAAVFGVEDYRTLNGLEYPPGSQYDNLISGGLWIGAIVDTGKNGRHQYARLVTTADDFEQNGFKGYVYETCPVDTLNPWRYTSTLYGGEPNKRGFDDDEDGRIDCDPLDGIDNDGDGKIDEDFGAVSESDYYCAYTDTSKIINNPYHHPIGIKILQSSYAWIRGVREPIIIIDYKVINLGRYPMRDVYIGFNFVPDLRMEGEMNNYSTCVGYWPELMTAYAFASSDRNATPFGVTALKSPKPLDSLDYYFRWLTGAEFYYQYSYPVDTLRYRMLSGVHPDNLPDFRPDMKPDQGTDGLNVIMSYGPINDWHAGDTLSLSFGIVGGRSLLYNDDNLYDNAKVAQTLYARNFYPFFVPPSPKLSIETGFRSNILSWGYKGEGENPEESWDDQNSLVNFFPPDHWRRANPPEGHLTGGRVFEGYRLYRSDDPGGPLSSFVMLRQWDMKDSIGPVYGYDTGLDTTFVDENLTTGKVYWYSVTSYGIPDQHLLRYKDRDGLFKTDTLSTNSLESSVLASRKRTKLPFSVSRELNKVLVVPNPYRVDQNYTYEMGGFEGWSKQWNENKRVIKFIHLPPKCTLRIFSLSGDLITTLYHENESEGELMWDLLSQSNRTIASGVYIFTVESDYGTQTGKFVIIR